MSSVFSLFLVLTDGHSMHLVFHFTADIVVVLPVGFQRVDCGFCSHVIWAVDNFGLVSTLLVGGSDVKSAKR